MTAAGRRAGEVIGPFCLQERLGRGGFSEVWRAVDGAGAPVALKLPTHPLFIRHLRTEKVALAQLEHPNLVRELAFDAEHDPPYLAMEYVEGENLRQAIAAEEDGFSVPQIVSVSGQILDALQAVHDAGLIHRDLKPENVLVATDGTAKLIDLGLGRAVETLMAEVHVSLSMVSAAPVEGTLAYMAPEQKWGGQVTPASDLYAFGVILFEMLTGQLPRGVTRATELVPELSERFDVILRRALANAPEDRFESATQMRELISITLRERDPVPLPCAPPVDPAEEVSLADQGYLELTSPFQPGDRVGRYTLEGLLGRGGFGEVWKVVHDDAHLALKLPLGPSGQTRLRYEAELSGRVEHPRIPSPVAVHLEAEPPHLVYPFVDGLSLRAVLNERGGLGLAVGLTLLSRVAELLAYCHARQIVHRDLKPENILYGTDGHPYLLDLGLGRAQGDTAKMARIEVSLATAQGVVGTYDYMSPEQRRGERAGPPADLYALGVLAFEVLTGHQPSGVASLRDAVPEIPLVVETTIRRLLSDDPAKRGTAEGVARELSEFDTGARPVLRGADAGLNWGAVVMSAVAVLWLIVAVGGWWIHPRSFYAPADLQMGVKPGMVDCRYNVEGQDYWIEVRGQRPGMTGWVAYHVTDPGNGRFIGSGGDRRHHQMTVTLYRMIWITALLALIGIWLAFFWRRI